MMRSPRSASATNRARSRSGGIKKGFDIAFGPAVDQRDTAGELTEFGHELAGPLRDHRRDMAEPVPFRHCNLPRQNDEHARAGLAGLKYQFAIAIAAHLAEPMHPRDFRGGQIRKGLFVARKQPDLRNRAAGFGRFDQIQ